MRIRPYITICPAIDWRSRAGVQLWSRGGVPVSLPAFAEGEGVYADLFDLLHSRGRAALDAAAANRRDLSSELQAAWDPAAYVTIGAADRVEIWGPLPFTVHAGAANILFGIDPAGSASVFEGAAHVVRGTADFSRDTLIGAQLTLQVGAGLPFKIPSSADYGAQGVPVLLRRRGRQSVPAGGDLGAHDIDDAAGALCLEALDNAAAGGAANRIAHFSDMADSGRHTMVWPALAGIADPVFATTDEARELLSLLGWTGSETSYLDDGRRILRADKPPALLIAPARPWIGRPIPLPGESVDAERLQRGGAARDHVASWVDHQFRFWLDGPDSPNTDDNLAELYAYRVRKLMPAGTPITVTIGRDTRRRLRADQVDAQTPAFSLLHSSHLCSGTWHVMRSPDDPASARIEYDEDLGGQFWARAAMIVSERTE